VTTFYFIRHGAIFQEPDLTDPSLALMGLEQLASVEHLKEIL